MPPTQPDPPGRVGWVACVNRARNLCAMPGGSGSVGGMCKPRSKSLRHAGRIEVQVARKTCAGKLTPCRLWPLVGVECLSLWGVSVSCSHALLRLAASLLTLSARRLCGASEETLFFFARGILAVVGLLARSRAPPLSFFNRCLHRHGLPGSGGSRASSPWTTWLGWAAWFRGFELSRVVRARPCMHQRAVRSVGVGSSIALRACVFCFVLFCFVFLLCFRGRFLDVFE